MSGAIDAARFTNKSVQQKTRQDSQRKQTASDQRVIESLLDSIAAEAIKEMEEVSTEI